jgi:FMN phosphatase YigB (HAD superfamily)
MFRTKPNKDNITIDYYNETWYIRPHVKNIEFLVSLSNRGYYIIVHSGNGWQHAEKVIRAFGLELFVDEVKSKPVKYCDDLPVEEWFGPRIYLEE